MNFTDARFLVLFVVVFVLWRLVRRHESATFVVLIVSSLVFYGYYVWQWIPLLLTYCVIDWALGLAISSGRRPKLILTVSVLLNLAGLACCKYTPLVLETVMPIVPALDAPEPRSFIADWVVPCGISFYCFTGIAYLVDVYRGAAVAERNLWRFTLYLTFFPQLVAGPILRPHDFLDRLQPGRMPSGCTAPLEACALITRGYVKKLVLADRIAVAVDPYFAHVGDPTTAGVWSLPYLYLYALQIYFDFSAYTDVARGLGLLFGFCWPENFDRPYAAASIQDFWRRWHITLSLFLRDYLYISLGGSRCGRVRVTCNVMVTMLLGGLWHGASWSFVLWGGLHGACLVLQRVWSQTSLAKRLSSAGPLTRRLWHLAAIVFTFHFVCFAWSFFRLTQIPLSLACLAKLVQVDPDLMLVGGARDVSLWVLLAAYAVLSVLVKRGSCRLSAHTSRKRGLPTPFVRGVQWGTVTALFILSFLLSSGTATVPFIYFQF